MSQALGLRLRDFLRVAKGLPSPTPRAEAPASLAEIRCEEVARSLVVGLVSKPPQEVKHEVLALPHLCGCLRKYCVLLQQ